MVKKHKKTTPHGRDAEKGIFIPVEEARRRRKTAVVEEIPNRKKKKK